MRTPLSTFVEALLPLIALPGLLVAQAQAPGEVARLLPQRTIDPHVGPLTALSAGDLSSIPIHIADRRAEYGTWASGPDYKVSFHDHMTFYPVLGSAYPHNLPLGWTSTEVWIGGECLMRPESKRTRTHSDWRYEYRSEAITERYDVVKEGVEQTFILNRPAKISGDLVIRGFIETPLWAEPAAFQYGALVFRHNRGEAIVQYGAAVAIDAAGQWTPVATSFDGSAIALRVDHAWLATASYPVVVDPLLSTVVLSTRKGAPAAHVRIASDENADDLIVAYSRLISANDSDGWVVKFEDDFRGAQIVFANVSTNFDVSHLDVAFIPGARKWIVVMQRWSILGTFWTVSYHLHDSGDYRLLTTTRPVANTFGPTFRCPDVGGGLGTNTRALIVFQSDVSVTQANTINSEVQGVIVDAVTGLPGTVFRLARSGGSTKLNVDREFPAVNQVADGGGWICAWQEYRNNVTADDWSVRAVRVQSRTAIVGDATLGSLKVGSHSIRPQVAGNGNRFMLLYGKHNNTSRYALPWASAVHAQRFDWTQTANLPRVLRTQAVQAPSGRTSYRASDIAYDPGTRSHWTGVYDSRGGLVYASRLGFAAGAAETAVVYSGSGSDTGHSPGVTVDRDMNRFPIVFAVSSTSQPVMGNFMTYASAQTLSYGTGCGTGMITSVGVPHSGSEFYTVRLQNAPAKASTILFIGLATSRLDLGFIGMPGCVLNVNPSSFVAVLGGVTNSVGFLPVGVPLPAPLSVDVYFQFAYHSPGANALELQATRGLQARVR